MKNTLDLLTDNLEIHKEISIFYESYQQVSALTYNDIYLQARNYAKNIQKSLEECGIHSTYKQPILISLETSKEFLYSFFGIILSGNIPVPVATATIMLPNDFSQLINQISMSCEAKLIISNFKISKSNLIALSTQVLEREQKQQVLVERKIQEDDICFIQYSSGSTQAPKGIAVTHKNLMKHLAQIVKGMHVSSEDIICSWLPLHHDMGLVGVLLASLYSKVQSHMMTPIDFILSPKSWLNIISEKKVSIIVAPNSAYAACVKKVKDEDKREFDFSSLRLALSGAEPVNRSVCEKFTNHFKSQNMSPNVIFPVYGLAECTLAVSFNDINDSFTSISVNYDLLSKDSIIALESCPEKAIDLVSVGTPLEGTEVKIVNEVEKPEINTNYIGEIFVKGPSVVSSYYNKKSHLIEGWLATGDLGGIINKKLYIVGRKKDLIITNGKNIAPHDIELKASEVAGIKMGRIVAFSFADKEYNEKVKLVAEVCNTNKLQRNEIKIQLVKKLRSTITLKVEDIFLLPPLYIKKTTSGKIKRFYIKDMFMRGKVQKWEQNYTFHFLQTQFLILKIKSLFYISSLLRITSLFILRRKRSINNEGKYQYGTK